MQQSTAPPENTHYCPGCQQRQPVQIDEPGEERYYQENVSIVRCGGCGDALAHLVWWPSRDEDYMEI